MIKEKLAWAIHVSQHRGIKLYVSCKKPFILNTLELQDIYCAPIRENKMLLFGDPDAVGFFMGRGLWKALTVCFGRPPIIEMIQRDFKDNPILRGCDLPHLSN